MIPLTTIGVGFVQSSTVNVAFEVMVSPQDTFVAVKATERD
jgi:hypothetical protein